MTLQQNLSLQITNITEHWGYYELYNVPLLCCKLISSMEQNGYLHCYTWEGRSAKDNGFFDLLDQLCEYYNWNKSCITLESGNWVESHPEYVIFHTLHKFYSIVVGDNKLKHIDHNIPWNNKKYYGMFLGRATPERMYCSFKHHSFKYKNSSLTSFNHNIKEVLQDKDALTYLTYSGQTVNQMLNTIVPYSDINDIFTSAIGYPDQTLGWEEIYRNIPLEIICETSVSTNVFDPSEKTWRPMIYKRPFLAIGSKSFLARLREVGYKTFEAVIPDYYDDLEDNWRIDAVFNILADLIDSGKINTLLDDCKEDLEHNYNQVIELTSRWYFKIPFTKI